MRNARAKRHNSVDVLLGEGRVRLLQMIMHKKGKHANEQNANNKEKGYQANVKAGGCLI